LLALADAPDTDGGEEVWEEVMPANESETSQALRTDLELGLVSKQTASGKRNYVWEDEETRITSEKASEDNIGAALLRTFNQGL